MKKIKSFESFKRIVAGGVEYLNDKGQKHREDGPAVEYDGHPCSVKEWWINGERHRENGPAMEFSDGRKYWYLNGKCHREDGPAVEYTDGKEWWKNGARHREDGPAIEYINGHKEWYLNGKRHREDGPAVEKVNGDKEWYLNGMRHREDGPAVEWNSGYQEWYLNGKFISESQFIKKLTNQDPNPNPLPIEDLRELSADLCDEYSGEVKQWNNFYVIYFKDKLDKNGPDFKSFKKRMSEFKIKCNDRSILVY